MKVAINAMQVRAAKSGVGQYIAGLIEAMAAVAPDDDFTIYCSAQNHANYNLPAPNLHAKVWGLPQHRRALRLINEYARFPAELRRGNYDVFLGPSNFLPIRKVCPYVLVIHDLSYYVQPERCPWVRRRYWYSMTARSVRLADFIITDSENSRRDIARFFPHAADRVRVIPLGIHERYRPTGTPREESAVARHGIHDPYLLVVGTLEPGKNTPRIIAAFDVIAARFPRHQLVFIGDRGWLTHEIDATFARAAAKSRIHFLGHLPDEDVVDFMNHCETLVFPSLYEGFGLPPLEAMACGAPVLASNVSSLPEVLGDAALLVDPYSVDELAKGMARLLISTRLNQDFRIRGLQHSANFTWERTATETLRVLRSAIQTGKQKQP